MIGRLLFVSMLLMGGVYTVLWLIAYTPFFRNKRRNSNIMKTSFLLLIAGVVTVLVMAFFITVDKLI